MKAQFRPSVNIVRDTDHAFNYLPTPNANQIVSQLKNDFQKGIRAFNLIGSYGTGKSSFLWALEQSLLGKHAFFETSFLPNTQAKFFKVVGSHDSIIDVFATQLEITVKKDKVEHILSELYNLQRSVSKRKPIVLLIVIDEFGKFLEYAAKNEPEKELYFMQQLAEFVNNTDYNIGLITSLHQSFESYSYSLARTQQQEWTKVKGRYRELVFNEPVEQLLYLAAEHLGTIERERPTKRQLQGAFTSFKKSRAFPFTETYSREISDRLFPLDILAANVLTRALQKYGQNERSLFSFLESTDYTGLERFRIAISPFYGLPQVYDYLNFNVSSFLTSQYNEDFDDFKNIKKAIERIERLWNKGLEPFIKLVKAIGLLNTFAAEGSCLNRQFLIDYSETCLGIKEAGVYIDELEAEKVIFYRRHNKRYIVFEGSDLNITRALQKAEKNVPQIFDVAGALKRYYELPPVLASQYSYTTGTMRYFKYSISDVPINQRPEGEIDGFINLIFSETVREEEIAAHSLVQQEAILYGRYNDTTRIKTLLFQIETTRKVIEEQAKDKYARRELEEIRRHQQKLLNYYILDNLFRGEVTWYWQGQIQVAENKRQLNTLLSQICSQVYRDTPHFKNELINRHKLSGSIFYARKQYFKALVNNWSRPDLGFEADKYPPEKTIYLTLLRENNLTAFADELNRVLEITPGSTFQPLWNYCLHFLEEARHERKSIADLVAGMKQRPLKLKQGFIDIWVPTFLFLKKDDFALFGEHGFIPELSAETLELVAKNPEEYIIKAFAIEGIRLDIFNSYRILLNQETKEQLSSTSFIETIKPFLVFYKQLPDYAKNTSRLSYEAKALRKAIATSTDPEQSFFEDFPAALNTSLSQLKENREDFEGYVKTLQAAIRSLRTATDELVNRVEQFIQKEIVSGEFDFESYQQRLQERYNKLKKHLLLPHQVTFVKRIDSGLDDRRAWLSSLAQALIGRSIDSFKDEDERVLYDMFRSMILELDALTELSKADIDEATEEALGVRLDSFAEGVKESVIRIPKARKDEIEAIKRGLQKKLRKNDKMLNIAALAKLMREIIEQ